ncbi:hypothetical protein D3C73_1026330 [compost metagenome]
MASWVRMPAIATEIVISVIPRNGMKLERNANMPHSTGMLSPHSQAIIVITMPRQKYITLAVAK